MNTPFGNVNNGYDTTNLTDQFPVIEGHTHIIPDVTGLPQALADRITLNEKGNPNGVASLDENGYVRPEQLRNIGSLFGLKVKAHSSLKDSHIGRVVMLNDNGEAVLYQNSPAVTEQYGKYEIEILTTAPGGNTPPAGTSTWASAKFKVGDLGDNPQILELSLMTYKFKIDLVEHMNSVHYAEYNSNTFEYATNIKTAFWAALDSAYPSSKLFIFTTIAETNEVLIQVDPSNTVGITPLDSNMAGLSRQTPTGSTMQTIYFSGGSVPPASPPAASSGDSVKIVLDTAGDDFIIYQEGWRNGRMPMNTNDEAAYIEEFFLSRQEFRDRWRVFRNSNKITIEENELQETQIRILGSTTFAKVTEITKSVIPLPEIPSRIPIGKLSTLSSDGTTAYINNGLIENYQAESSINIVSELTNLASLYSFVLDFDNDEEGSFEKLKSILGMIILPTNGGYVKALDAENDVNIQLRKYIKYPTKLFNHAILGLALYDTYEDNTIIVYNSQIVSLLVFNILKIFEQNEEIELYSIYEYTGFGNVIETPNNKWGKDGKNYYGSGVKPGSGMGSGTNGSGMGSGTFM